MSTRIVVLVFAITLGASHVGLGQETTGTISGRVVDSQGLPIPGATVTATGSQGTKQSVTDGAGNFTVPFLTPGTYAVRIELQGFTPFAREGVVVRLGQTVDIPATLIVGAAVGAAAMHGLHAQAKPKAYQVTELEVIDAEAWKTFVQAVRASQQQASGRNLRTAGGKVVAFVGDPPKSVGITEFDSLDQAVAYRNSQAFKDLDPLRNKAIKITKQYTVEAEQ